MTKVVSIAIDIKMITEASDLGEPRPSPQTPWPLVQPLPSTVPKPTKSPATTTKALFEVMDVAARADLKSDLLKELEPTGSQKIWILVSAFLVGCIAWGICLVAGVPRYRSR